jgi:D-glycero-alpha-D-manno-heptose-7-phosphate kinase
MILTRAPLRISIAGGGTDLESWYKLNGSEFISAAIDKYVYVLINETFNNHFVIKYSEVETPHSVDEIKHPLIRECLRIFEVSAPLEITTTADLPARTGLGSSSSFCVALIKALATYRGQNLSDLEIAELACKVEIEILREPIGKQDQYISALGSFNKFQIQRDGQVRKLEQDISSATITSIEQHSLLYFSGFSRDASSMLEDQKAKLELADAAMIASLAQTAWFGKQIESALESGDLQAFGSLLDQYWQVKRARTRGMSNDEIDQVYQLALANGAIGGKIVGA